MSNSLTLRAHLIRPSSLLAVLLLLAAAACGAPNSEERARAVAEEIRKGVVDPGEAALDQKLDRDLVQRVQKALNDRKEYMGEINGKLDAVTINAIQAFQRSVNAEIPWWTPWKKLNEAGVVDDPTRAQLFNEQAQG